MRLSHRPFRFARSIVAGAFTWSVLLLVAATAHAAPTVVSIEFDDGISNQYQARTMLSSRGMHGTFFINGGEVGSSGYYMTLAQIHDLANDGNEIGGHTLEHVDLPTLGAADQKHQICDDRKVLTDQGFRVTDFAYPFGEHDATSEQLAAACNYNSARLVSDLRAPDCSDCPVAESIPPANAYTTRTPQSVDTDMKLADIQRMVTQSELGGGGWVQIVFHNVCAGATCSYYSVTPTVLTQFLDWLRPRTIIGTTTKTVNQVIGGPVKPIVLGWPELTPDNLFRNPSLEVDGDADGTADCWKHGGYGNNTAAWSRTTDAHSGLTAERVDMSTFTDGDARFLAPLDIGSCSPPATPGAMYRFSVWYKGTTGSRIVSYSRDANGVWTFWSQSPVVLPATSAWTLATWTSPAVPAGVTGVSVGLSLRSVGSLTVDDLTLTKLP